MQLKNADFLNMAARKFGERHYYEEQYLQAMKHAPVDKGDMQNDDSAFVKFRERLQQLYANPQGDSFAKYVSSYMANEMIKIFIYSFNKFYNRFPKENSTTIERSVIHNLYNRIDEEAISSKGLTRVDVARAMHTLLSTAFYLSTTGGMRYFFGTSLANRDTELLKDICYFGGDRDESQTPGMGEFFINNIPLNIGEKDIVDILYYWLAYLLDDKLDNPIMRVKFCNNDYRELLEGIKKSFDSNSFLNPLLPSLPAEEERQKLKNCIEISKDILRDFIRDISDAINKSIFLSSQGAIEFLIKYISSDFNDDSFYLIRDAIDYFYKVCIDSFVWQNEELKSEEDMNYIDYKNILESEQIALLSFLPPNDPRYSNYVNSRDYHAYIVRCVAQQKIVEVSGISYYVEARAYSGINTFLSVRIYLSKDATGAFETTSINGTKVYKIDRIEYIPMRITEDGTEESIVEEGIEVNLENEQVHMSKGPNPVQVRDYNKIPNSGVINDLSITYNGYNYIQSITCPNPNCKKRHSAVNLLFSTNVIDPSGVGDTASRNIVKNLDGMTYDGDISFTSSYADICRDNPKYATDKTQLSSYGNACLLKRGVSNSFAPDVASLNRGYIPNTFGRKLDSMDNRIGKSDERIIKLFLPNSALVTSKLFICDECGWIGALPNIFIEQLTTYIRCMLTAQENSGALYTELKCKYIRNEFYPNLSMLQSDFCPAYKERLETFSLLQNLKDQYDNLDSAMEGLSAKQQEKHRQFIKELYDEANDSVNVNITAEDVSQLEQKTEEQIISNVLGMLQDYDGEVASLRTMNSNVKVFNYLLTLASNLGIKSNVFKMENVIRTILDFNPFYSDLVKVHNTLREVIYAVDLYSKLTYREHNRTCPGAKYYLNYGVDAQAVLMEDLRKTLKQIICGLYSIIPMVNFLDTRYQYSLIPHQITAEDCSLFPEGSLVYEFGMYNSYNTNIASEFEGGPLYIPAPQTIFCETFDNNTHRAVFYSTPIYDENIDNGVSIEEILNDSANNFIELNPFMRLYKVLTDTISAGLFEADFMNAVIPHHNTAFKNTGYRESSTVSSAKDAMLILKNCFSDTNENAIYSLFDLLYARHSVLYRDAFNAGDFTLFSRALHKNLLGYQSTEDVDTLNVSIETFLSNVSAISGLGTLMTGYWQYLSGCEVSTALYANKDLFENPDITAATVETFINEVQGNSNKLNEFLNSTVGEQLDELYRLLHFQLNISWNTEDSIGYDTISEDSNSRYLDSLMASSAANDSLTVLYGLGLTSLIVSNPYFVDYFSQQFIDKSTATTTDKIVEAYLNNCITRWGGKDITGAASKKEFKHSSRMCAGMFAYLEDILPMAHDDLRADENVPEKTFSASMRLMFIIDQIINTAVGYLDVGSIFKYTPENYSLMFSEDESLLKFLPNFIANYDTFFLQTYIDDNLRLMSYVHRNAFSEIELNRFSDLNRIVLMDDEHPDSTSISQLRELYKKACIARGTLESGSETTTFFSDENEMYEVELSLDELMEQDRVQEDVQKTDISSYLPDFAHEEDGGLGITDVMTFINMYAELTSQLVPSSDIYLNSEVYAKNPNLEFSVYNEYNAFSRVFYKKCRNIYLGMDHLYREMGVYSQICVRQLLYECRNLK